MATEKVEYRRVGSSGLKISVPVFGAASVGSDQWQPYVLNEEAALPVLKHAWDRGINTFDTSNNYSNGLSEKVLGQFMKQYNIPRSQIVIMTKCWGLVADIPGLTTATMPELQKEQKYQNQYGLSRTAIFNAVEGSLKRLGTDYIDLYQIHRWDRQTPPEETMKALHDLVQAGKVRYIGASTMYTWQFAHLNAIAEKNGWTKFVSIQPEYSLLYREEERELIPYCKYHGIGIIPYFVLAAGALGRPLDAGTSDSVRVAEGDAIFEVKQSQIAREIISRVEKIAKERGKSTAQVALAWAKAKITSPLIGLAKIERIDDVIGVNGFELTEEENKYLEEPYQPMAFRGLFDY